MIKMTNELNIDNFKTYEGYENMYVVDSYIRYLDHDSVIFATKDGMEAMEYMDNNDLWEDGYLFYIDSEGVASFPEF